mgnify:CR=1 FL=1
MKRKLPDRTTLRQLRMNGASRGEIARTYKSSPRAVTLALRKAGIPSNPVMRTWNGMRRKPRNSVKPKQSRAHTRTCMLCARDVILWSRKRHLENAHGVYASDPSKFYFPQGYFEQTE